MELQILCEWLVFQSLPVHIFRMGCEADAPPVNFQSSALRWRLGHPPAAAACTATLECIEVFQNAEVRKWQLLVIHINQLSTMAAAQRPASSKKSCGDSKTEGSQSWSLTEKQAQSAHVILLLQTSGSTDVPAVSLTVNTRQKQTPLKCYSLLGHSLGLQGDEGHPQGALWHQLGLLPHLLQQVLFFSTVVRYSINLKTHTQMKCFTSKRLYLNIGVK